MIGRRWSAHSSLEPSSRAKGWMSDGAKDPEATKWTRQDAVLERSALPPRDPSLPASHRTFSALDDVFHRVGEIRILRTDHGRARLIGESQRRKTSQRCNNASEITPVWVYFFNQCLFPFSRFSFDEFFPCYSLHDSSKPYSEEKCL